VRRFSSDAELVSYSQKFARGHIGRFRKDISICLKGKPRKGQRGNYTHAYFPALMACIGILDLFSGLYAGKIERHNVKELKKYSRKFLPNSYTNELVEIVYDCFRHKVAHLGHPYPVFDTTSNPRNISAKSRKLIGWSVKASKSAPAFTLKKLQSPKIVSSAPPGWGVKYDHAMYVSVRQFATDIVVSIRKYLAYLRNSKVGRKRFKKCMNDYFAN
jgi:hypothetical protein